ncbi:BTB/POZ domain-containing protein 9-like [Adelges cooleyi]|uniref:BTB/POZ domain-containing protein 9-like n=1 Tax=Adelges cooleyi TaxID=133065 RepID=UPI00217F7BB3|nr:BTB/POZ domain-containing protein 9-like [Adelges cooleyi]
MVHHKSYLFYRKILLFFLAFYYPIECTPSSSTAEQHSKEQIDHGPFLVNDIGSLYLDERYSDVVLIVDKERLHAHRVVLASRCEYFRPLLYGNYIESHKSEVNISFASATSFKILLKYIYTGRMNLSVLKNEVILEIFNISDYFCFPNLKPLLSKYLLSKINVHSACSMFSVASLYKHEELEVEAQNFIDKNAMSVLQSRDFLTLSSDEIQQILNRDSLLANEMDIFRAVCWWIRENQGGLGYDAKIKVLSAVRYPLMSDEELMEVEKSQLVSSDTILDAKNLRNMWPPDKLQFRGQLRPNVSLTYDCHGVTVIQNIQGCDMIKLRRPSTINYIKVMIWDGVSRIFSFYVEVSMNEQDWVRIVDHSHFFCRKIQYLWFHPRIVSYIRIRRTHSTVKMTSKYFEVSFNTKRRHLVEIENGLVVPKYNVASLTMYAVLTTGVNNSSTHFLLDGDYNMYDRHHGYTYHALGSGCIVVQLDQPYMLSSMRMLLWDYDEQHYMYTIEASVNNIVWEMVVDKSKELTQSWQLLQFDPRPIVFIRITGVYSSDGNDFRCVYLEAPAQVPLDSNVIEDDRVKNNNETDITMAGASKEASVV